MILSKWVILLYVPFCILFAYLNSRWIPKVSHFLNGLLHIAVATFASIFTKEWWHFFTVLLITRVFFDWSLNLFRGLPLGYVSLAPRSIVDRVEKKIFGLDGITPKVIYLIAIIILLFL